MEIDLYTVIAAVVTFLLGTSIWLKFKNTKFAKIVDTLVALLAEARDALADGKLEEAEVKEIKAKIDEFLASFKSE